MNMDKEKYIDAKGRIQYIDGMRGFLAVLVVVNHVVCAFFPWFFYDSRAVSVFPKMWINSPLNAFTNGNFAVQFFYIISGYLISKSYFKKTIIFRPLSLLLKTYKITVPSILLVCALMKWGVTLNNETVLLNPALTILDAHNNFNPSWREALFEALYKIFTVASCKYNAPLWFIMPYFWGTIVVHLLNGYFQRCEKYGYIMVMTFICIAGLYVANYSACGMLFGLLVAYTEKCDNKILDHIHCRKELYFCYLLFVVYFATINIEATGIWCILHLNSSMTKITIIRQAACGLLFYEITRSNLIKKIFSFRLLRELGKDSVFIFAYHWALLLTLGCKLYISMRQNGMSGVIEGCILLIITVLITVIIHRFINYLQSKILIIAKSVIDFGKRGKTTSARKKI